MKPKTAVLGADLHFPEFDRPTVSCMFEFIDYVKPEIFVFMGDQFNNQSISHHTAGRPGLRLKREFKTDTLEFERQILTPLEKLLPKNAMKVWIKGNHDGWIEEFYEIMPELEGMLDREEYYRLRDRGWTVIQEGHSWKYGKLTHIHGETLKTQNHAKNAVETLCRNVVYGHFHTPQSWTKVLPHDASQKWAAQCLPILGAMNPGYLKNKPTNWVQGFGVVEYHSDGAFNLFPVNTINGRAAYGGKIYGKK